MGCIVEEREFMLRTGDFLEKKFKQVNGWKNMSASELNELKKTMLIISDDFVKFCNEYNLQYCVAYGTALGAIRHKGFIPWDDDMDFFLPREDYEKFLKIGVNKLSNKYWIRSVELGNKIGIPTIHMKLKNTYYVNYGDMVTCMDEPTNTRGIYIDIFPLDNCSIFFISRFVKFLRLTFIKFKGSCINFYRSINILKQKNVPFSKKEWNSIKFKYLIGKRLDKTNDLIKIMCKFNRVSKGKNNNSKYVMSYGYTNFNKIFIKRSEIFPTGKGTFEKRAYCIPHNYDAFLTRIYGNYHLIPSDCNKRTHPVFELNFHLKDNI